MPENPPTSDNTGQQDHISNSAAGRVVSVRFSERDYERIARVAGKNVSGFIRWAAKRTAVDHGMPTAPYFVCNAPSWSDGINGRTMLRG